MTESQLEFEIKSVTFHNLDNGWTVLRGFIDEKPEDLITIIGSFGDSKPGERYKATGAWVTHPKFGKQFKVQQASPVMPTDPEGLVRYLSSGLFKGIGKRTASRLVDKFGTDILDVLSQHPEKLLTVEGVGRGSIQKILAAWRKNIPAREAIQFLTGHGLTLKLTQKIIALYGDKTISQMLQNPYDLIGRVYGIGFLRADQIGRNVGIKLSDTRRVMHGILFQLQVSSDMGHCFLPLHKVRESLPKLLTLSEDEINLQLSDQINNLIKMQKIIALSPNLESALADPTCSGSQAIFYLPRLYGEEMSCSDVIRGLIAQEIKPIDPKAPITLPQFEYQELSEEQQLAVMQAFKSRIFILTGGPGVGKTTTSNLIIKGYRSAGYKVLLAAPTGRAAQRLATVSGGYASTIHRLLEWSATEGGFTRGPDRPIVADVVIIDEASMLDISLAAALLGALPPNGILILIGDVDQLPSVGPGNVLRDMLNSERVPNTMLRKIFRQASTSAIVRHAHSINKGSLPEFENTMDSNCWFLEAETPEETRSHLQHLYERVLPEAGWNTIADVQLLTPMNRGELGTQALNGFLRGIVHKQNEWGGSFEVGDKVIQVANNYDLGVFNGDIGYVIRKNLGSTKYMVKFTEREVAYTEEQSMDLQLAYAITIHKSQGSEFPVVVIPISTQHFVMLQRNLVYTALTRARSLAVFVGTTKALRMAIMNRTAHQRYTRLEELIRGGMGSFQNEGQYLI